MPRLGRISGGAFAVFVATVGVAACGGSNSTATSHRVLFEPTPRIVADVRALRKAPCPAPYVVAQDKSYTKAKVAQARRGEFHIHFHTSKLVPPVDWSQDPYHSKGWSSTFASLKWLDVLIYAYRHGDTAALAQARDLLLDWIEHNPRDQPATRKSWFNKVIGDRAQFLAYITRAASCEGMLDAKQAATLVGSIAEHGRALTDPSLYTPTNHGLFMDFGLASLGREASYMPQAAHWRKLAPRRFERSLLHRVYPREGFWLENSSSYHLAARTLTEKFVALLGNSVPASLERLAARMNKVAGWLIVPGKRRVLLGDSNLKPTPPGIVPSPKHDNGLLWLPRSGIAIVKRPAPDHAFLLFAATFHHGVHNQADALTLDLESSGRRVLTDSGLYDKEPDPYQRFSRSSYSHSVMTIDNQSFPLGEGKAYGSGLRAVGQGGGWYAMEGVNPLARLQGVVHHRLVLYKPGYGLVVVDFAASGQTHTYRRYFQLGPKLGTSRHHGAIRIAGSNGFVAQLSSTGTAPSQVKLWNGHTHPVRGFMFPDYRVKVPRTTVQYTARGRSVNQVASLALDRSRIFRGTLADGSNPDHAQVTLRGPRSKPTVLEIDRSHAKLGVTVR
jgi:hypothetical protein